MSTEEKWQKNGCGECKLETPRLLKINASLYCKVLTDTLVLYRIPP